MLLGRMIGMPAELAKRIARLGLLLACALAALQPAEAQEDRIDPPHMSCFASPDYCVRSFARTHDRDYYDLCLLSEKICRAYRYDWTFMRNRLSDRSVMEGIPASSVADLLFLCKGEQFFEKEGCHEHIDMWMSKADVRGDYWQLWSRRHFPVACTTARSISEAEYIKAFVTWAEQHPSKRDISLVDGLIAAAAATWPCPGRTPDKLRSHPRSRR